MPTWIAPRISTNWVSTTCSFRSEASWDRNRLAAPEQFLPLLDRVAKNASYLHISQERAAEIAEAIRNPKSQEKSRETQ